MDKNITSNKVINPAGLAIAVLILIVGLIYLGNLFYHKNSIPPELLLRCDDIGMSMSVNNAVEKLTEKKIPFSASVIVNSGCYLQAIEILKLHPEVSVGVHIALTSEWESQRWKPVLPKEKVKSLIDSNGYFYPSRSLLLNTHPDTAEIEAEAEAQIQKLLSSGLKVDYIDSHMFFLYSPLCNKILKRLGEKYNLLVSQMNNEMLLKDLYITDASHKLEKYTGMLSSLQNGETYLMVLHLASSAEELNAMKDLNRPAFKENGNYRFSEFKAVTSDRAQQVISKNNVILKTYADLHGIKVK